MNSIEVVFEELAKLIREGQAKRERENDASLLVAAAVVARKWLAEVAS